ncbi:hypothetical protein BBJ28_00017851 [Nothophytophthora sp. Chile5]|nr:hypothetical protein BBJ28_00017851 [Nothophytophthora sp. Chile5]
MPAVVDTIQPLSTATTVPSSFEPSQAEANPIASTGLEQAIAQKIAGEHDIRPRVGSASAAVLGAGMPESHYRNGQLKLVQFAGLYVVRGATVSKHVRYTMDVAVADQRLRGRCIQRFQSFFLLRKRLLNVLKSCRGGLPPREVTREDGEPAVELSAGLELVQFLTRPRCVQCPGCEATRRQLAAIKFPHRTLFPATPQHIQERSLALEAFLDFCVGLAVEWPACQRRKRLFRAALGKFLGLDLVAFLATQKDGNDSEVRTERTDSNQDEDKQQPPVSGDIPLLPSPHEIETSHSVDVFEDDRQTEPTFSFISIPSSDGEQETEGDGKMQRSKSQS